MEKEIKIFNENFSSFYGIITSLLLYKNYLFIGKGNYLIIYNIETNKQVFYKKIFNSNKILLISQYKFNDKNIILFLGETLIKYSIININDFLLNFNYNDFNLFEIKTFSNDYLLDNLLIKTNDNKYILILGFINNYIEIYNFDNENKFNYFKIIFSPLQCMLYSMAFNQNIINNNKILIASGTVFTEIILWELDLNNYTNNNNNCLKLKGHLGVIFSLKFISNNKLLSTSDDRTTKLWEFDYENKTFNLYNFFGHTSRVWNTAFNNKIFVSISEDATARVYDLNEKKFLYELKNGHVGKNIRSIILNDKFIFTGGEDGQIIQWKIQDIKNDNNNEKENKNYNLIEYKLDNNCDECKKLKIINKNFQPLIKVIKFLNEENVIIGTNYGQILLYNILNKDVKILYNDIHYREGNCLNIIDNYIFYGLSNGHLIIIDTKEINKFKEFKIFDLRIIYINYKIIDNYLHIIICNAIGNIKLFSFNYNNNIINIFSNNNYLEFNLKPDKFKFITAFELIKISNNNCNYDNYILILGEFSGKILFTKLSFISECFFNYNNQIKFLQIHSNKISNILYLNNIIYTYSRDGKMKKFLFNKILTNFYTLIEFDSFFKNEINSIENIFYINEDNYNENFYILGFSERNILIYDNIKKNIIHENNIKGLNRPFDSIINKNKEKIIYTYSQSDKIFILNVDLKINENNIFIKNIFTPLHGRVIHYIELFNLDNKNYLIYSGGEDTKINFYLINDIDNLFIKNIDLIFLKQFSRHTSAIRKVKLIKIYNLDKNIKQLIFCSIASKSEIFLFKLIINLEIKSAEIILLKDFTTKEIKGKKIEYENNRNFDLTFYDINNYLNLFIINSVCNTFNFRINFNDEEEQIKIIENKTYDNLNKIYVAFCINNIIYKNNVILFYGYSNGNFSIQKLNDNKFEGKIFKLHNSAINDIKIFNNDDNEITYIFTCSEDCSLIISEYNKINDNFNILINKKIHFSSIKSIFIKQYDINNFLIFSASYDQSINIFNYNVVNNKLNKLKKFNTCVSEINSISVCQYNNNINDKYVITAAGQGIEFYYYYLNK